MSKQNTHHMGRMLVLGGILCVAVAVAVVILRPWDTQTSGQSSSTPKTKETSKVPQRGDDPVIKALKLPTTLPAKPVFQALSPDIKLLTTEMLKTEALDVCRKMLKEFPTSTTPLVLMAEMQNKFGNRTEAAKWWRQVLKREPRRIDVYFNLAAIADTNGDYEEAVTLCRKAFTLGPPIQGMYHGTASCLLQLGKPAEAVDALQQELRHFPNNTESYGLMGRAYSQLKQYDKAVASYEKLLSISPRDKAACYGLTIACAKLGQTDKARKYREKFAVLSKEKDAEMRTARQSFDDTERMRRLAAHAQTGAGEIEYRHQRPDKAEQRLKRACALDPGATLCRGKLVSLYMTKKRSAEALEVCRQLSQIEPLNPLHRQNNGVLLGGLKRFSEAAEALRKSVALAPKEPSGYHSLARILMHGTRNFPEAQAVAEKLVKLEPTGMNYYTLSQACQANKDLKRAWEAIDQAHKLAPANNRIRQAYLRLQPQTNRSQSGKNK